MTDQAQKLRDLIARGEHFIAADAYSALTARIVERVGFAAAYLGGGACSAFHYAIPDNGIFSQIEQLEQASRIVDAIDIPLVVDADTLGETVADAFHLVQRYVRAGVAGIHIEDEINPKHSTFSNGLISIPDMQARLATAAKARKESALVLIARCDELYPDAYRGGGSGSIDAAIERGLAYAEAGADMLVFPLATPEAGARLVEAMPVPIAVLGAPIAGAMLTLHTGWGWMGAAQLHLKRATELYATGSIADLNMTLEGKDALIQQDVYDALIADWAQQSGRPVRS